MRVVSAPKPQLRHLSIPIYELKVQLEDIAPPIWRRVLVFGNINLGKLHEVVQVVMGWSNSHLHEFIVGSEGYSDPEFEIENTRDEFRYRLRRVAPRVKNFLAYSYDFGDGWEHQIRVERIIEGDQGYPGWPICIDGARACPPEDCGGIGGYENFLEAIANPRHKQHRELLQWVGGSFDPEAFDIDAVNKMLKTIK